jgi:diguanylate cyclase (GGDEF)-like protein
VLKGQMVRFDEPDGEVLLFLCSPVVRELDSVANMGLTLNDFAIHDASVDFLILLQTKTNTINDVRKMADRLKQEVAVRREAEKQLKLANEDLENRVAERTQQLTRTNENLHNEIAERERVEEELQVTNIQLKSWVKKLEVYNRQISLLNKMGDMLQACRSVKETYSVIIDSAQQLFPTDSGFLSLQDETDKTFRIVATWGVQDGKGSQFLKDDCWALRRARLHIAEAGEVEALCGHMGMDAPQHGYICAPLTVQGELLGTLHLHCDTCNPRKDRDFVDAEARKHLVQTATEHIGLAIANLRLQESLRQQTIRDALTGLYNRRHMEDSLERETLRAQRNHSTVAVIMTDVDHFKKFNDNFGHQAGDALLRDLGAFLKQHVRGEDIACRYGGEEFILILPTACKEIAMARAEKIREGVENDLKVEFNGSYLPQVTLSLGVAVFPESAATAQEAVMAADAALYHSKQHGRNQATFATAEIIAAGVKEKPH